MSESLEVRMARLDERMQVLIRHLEDNRSQDKETQRWTGSVDSVLTQMSARMESVEASLASNAPTINEFIQIKHKIIGAGVAGRWAWAIAAGTIGMVYTFREHLIAALSKGGQ